MSEEANSIERRAPDHLYDPPKLGMPLAGVSTMSEFPAITVPAGAYSQAGAQALVDALLADLNTMVQQHNLLLQEIRKN